MWKGSDIDDLANCSMKSRLDACIYCSSTLENLLCLKCPFVKVCLLTRKKVGMVAADDPEEQDEIDTDDGFFLGVIENIDGRTKQWCKEVKVNGWDNWFKLDTRRWCDSYWRLNLHSFYTF